MEHTVSAAVESSEIPGVALLAADKSGKIEYAKCFGRRGISEDELPLQLDTVMRFASATKLVTSVACMQCVERRLLDLDADISIVLHELAGVQVLTGFDDQHQPMLREAKRPITLQTLLSHSSGLCYDAMHPLLIEYRKWQHVEIQPDLETIPERFLYPLVYDPGDGWTYGPSLEWAGKAVERTTGMLLNNYVQENVYVPLEIKDMTFKLQQRPDMLARRAKTCDRNEHGVLHAADNKFWDKDYTDDFGGMASLRHPSITSKS